jgi:nucleotide-binding universal stress UspA family protein
VVNGVDTNARPVVLALVEDRVGSRASLLLAADIAAAQQALLHVAHVRTPRLWAGMAGNAVPAYLWAEADRLAAEQLGEKVACLLALAPPVEWTFTWTVGNVHQTLTRLVGALSPIAVVMGAPRRHRLRVRPSLARWLIGRRGVPAVVAPA